MSALAEALGRLECSVWEWKARLATQNHPKIGEKLVNDALLLARLTLNAYYEMDEK